MLIRRVVAAIFVALPAVVAAILLTAWAPLPAEITVQWSGEVATTRSPLWLLLVPCAVLVVAALGFAIGCVVDRDRAYPHRLGFYVTGALSCASSAIPLVIIAANQGGSGPGGEFLAAIAGALAYGLVPLAIVTLGRRDYAGYDDWLAEEIAPPLA